MRWIIRSIVGTGILGVLFLGVNQFGLTLRGFRENVRQTVDDLKSDAQRAAELRVGMADYDKNLAVFAASVGETSDTLASNEADLSELRSEDARQRGILEHEKQLLADKRDSYEIGGRTYTLAQLTEDAIARAGEYRSLVLKFQAREAANVKLRNAAKAASSNLEKAKLARQQMAAELDELTIRLRNARMLASVNQLSTKLQDARFAPSDALREQFQKLRQDVRVAEAEANSPTAGAAMIDWSGSAETTASTVETLNRALNTSGKGVRADAR